MAGGRVELEWPRAGLGTLWQPQGAFPWVRERLAVPEWDTDLTQGTEGSPPWPGPACPGCSLSRVYLYSWMSCGPPTPLGQAELPPAVR